MIECNRKNPLTGIPEKIMIPDSNAELEQRIADLEEIVEQLVKKLAEK